MAKKIGKLAYRYAKALLNTLAVETAEGREQLERIANSLNTFAELWKKERELSLFLLNPMFEMVERKAALREIIKLLGTDEVVERFAFILLERDRLVNIGEIAQSFSFLADEVRKIVQVEVTTASALDDGERQSIAQSVTQQISGKPTFAWKVSPEILGGMILRYSGKVLDGSVQGRLERIERQLRGE